MDTIERGPPAENIQLVYSLPTQECGHQSTQPQDVIEMTVRQQNASQIFKASARLQDLTLCAFTAIDQKPILIMFDDLC